VASSPADISGDDVDFGVGVPAGERIGAAGRGVNWGDFVALGEGAEVDSTGFDANGVGVELAAARGVGVALGTSKRPRRCDAVGDENADGDEVGVEVADDVGDCSNRARLCGVITVSGVHSVRAAGVAVAGADVDVTEVSVGGLAVGELVAVAFTNFFDGAFGGGVASDFIFWRALFASS